jgi:hypothetical protein
MNVTSVLPRLRASSALWAAPVALGVTLFYFFESYVPDSRFLARFPDYAPSVTSWVLGVQSAMVYAAASCLAAWESGRLRRGGVWELAPARSRVRVACHALLPVAALAWTMVLLPVGMALVREGVAPTPGSMVLPLLVVALACAHLVIGFLIGLVVPPLVASPVLAVVVFYAVAASWSYEPFWPRHVSGQFPSVLGFGELPSVRSLLPHVLFTGAIALGAAMLWVPVRGLPRRAAVAVVAVAVAVAGTSTAYRMTRDWEHTPPLSAGHAAVTCAGHAPEVCVPEAAGADPAAIAAEVADVLAGLRAAGVPVRESGTVTDSLLRGWRDRPAPDGGSWLPLSRGHAAGTLRLTLVRRMVDFPCRLSHAEPEAAESALLWAAGTVGAGDAYLAWLRADVGEAEQGAAMIERVMERVARARELPAAEQTAWYAAEAGRACAGGGAA